MIHRTTFALMRYILLEKHIIFGLGGPFGHKYSASYCVEDGSQNADSSFTPGEYFLTIYPLWMRPSWLFIMDPSNFW